MHAIACARSTSRCTCIRIQALIQTGIYQTSLTENKKALLLLTHSCLLSDDLCEVCLPPNCQAPYCPVSNHTHTVQADSLATPSNLKIVDSETSSSLPILSALACEIDSRILRKKTVARIKKLQEQVGMAVPKNGNERKLCYVEKLCRLHLVCKYSCHSCFVIVTAFWHCHPYLLL